jgi:predicted nucleic acid-binding protein
MLHLTDARRVLECVKRRPLDKREFGLSLPETDRIARVIERDFEFLPDSRDVHDRWRQLLVAHEVKGGQSNDARLAASMYVHGITHLLTVNVRDFQRFKGLRVIHPAEVIR